jgi:hypothetical protein
MQMRTGQYYVAEWSLTAGLLTDRQVARITVPYVEEVLMVRMIVRHEVNDFAAWRRAYNSTGELRDNGGVTAEAVYQSVDDPNDVTVTHDFATAEAARAFAQSAELRSAMESAGVASAPTIWFVSEAP